MASTPKETTTKTEPWDGAKPYIEKYLAQADKLYDTGQPAYYPGQTYADQSKATTDAMKMIEKTARKGTDLFDNAQNVANGVMDGSAFSSKPNKTLSTLQNGIALGTDPATKGAAQFANGSLVGKAPGDATLKQGMNFTNPGVSATQNALGNINMNYTNGAIGQAANANQFTNAAMAGQQGLASTLESANNPAMAMLQQTANGDFLNNNPYLDQAIANANAPLIEQFKTQIAPGIDSKAALAGRTGSGAHASLRNDAESTMANAMAKNASDIMYQNYGNERTNMLNAQNSIGSLYNSDVQNQMDALDNLSATSNAQQAQRLAGTELYGNLNNQQESIRQNANQLQLQGSGQLGNQAVAQQDVRNNSANILNNQYQFDRSQQMQGLGMQSDIYNQGIQNQFQNANLKMDAANSQFQNQNAKANTQLQAAGMADYLRGLDYYDANMLAGVGAQKDAWNNMVKQSDIAKWDYQQNQPFNNIANMINLANGGGYNNQTTPVYSNTGAQVLGGLTSLLGLFTCDARTKKVLRRVGVMPNGIPMYEFVYINDPDENIYIGPIAQEVEEIKPEAVIEIDGILHVLANELMEEPTWH